MNSGIRDSRRKDHPHSTNRHFKRTQKTERKKFSEQCKKIYQTWRTEIYGLQYPREYQENIWRKTLAKAQHHEISEFHIWTEQYKVFLRRTKKSKLKNKNNNNNN